MMKAYSCGNFYGYQFRVQGPHCNVLAVMDGYGLADSIHWLSLVWHVNHIFWLLQAPFFALWWSQLAPGVVGSLSESMMAQWY